MRKLFILQLADNDWIAGYYPADGYLAVVKKEDKVNEILSYCTIDGQITPIISGNSLADVLYALKKEDSAR